MELSSQIVQVKIEDIIPNRFQPRLNFKEEELNDLANSIKQHGIVQPLILRQLGSKYEIIAGERRYKAATMVGLPTVPAIISKMDDQTSAELALIENIQRQNLSSIEEAKSYKRILDMGKITQTELAERMGKKQTTIANKIRLLNLPLEVQNALLEGKISERHARTLLQINEKSKQIEILSKIINERLTVKETENIIKEILNNNANGDPDNDSDETPPNSIEKIKKNNTTLNIKNLNNPTISKKNIYDIIGDEDIMNPQNYNDLMQQPAQPIPETPIPAPTPEPEKKNSIFTNNFFPSLDDEKTNMNLNSPWTPTTPEPSVGTMTAGPSMVEPPINPEPVANVGTPSPMTNPNDANSNPWGLPTPGAPNPIEAPTPAPQTTMTSPNNSWNQVNSSNNSGLPNFIDQNISQNDSNPWGLPTPESSKEMPSNPEPVSNVGAPSPMSNPTDTNSNPWGLPTSAPSMENPTQNSNSWGPTVNQTDISALSNLTNPSPMPTSPTPTPTPNPWNAPASTETSPVPNFMTSSNNTSSIDSWQNPNLNNPLPNNNSMTIPQTPPTSFNTMGPQINEPPKRNINEPISKVRNVISEMETNGYKVQSSEIDMDTEYQIIIKIQKDN